MQNGMKYCAKHQQNKTIRRVVAMISTSVDSRLKEEIRREHRRSAGAGGRLPCSEGQDVDRSVIINSGKSTSPSAALEGVFKRGISSVYRVIEVYLAHEKR